MHSFPPLLWIEIHPLTWFLIVETAVLLGLLGIAWRRGWKARFYEPILWAVSLIGLMTTASYLPYEPKSPPDYVLRMVLIGFSILFFGAIVRLAQLKKGEPQAVPFLFVLATLFGLFSLMPGTGGGGISSSRRLHCLNNERNIGIAIINYYSIYKIYPPRAEGTPPVSWRVELGPFLDQTGLSETYNRTVSWNDPVNAFATNLQIPVFGCPELPRHLEGRPCQTAFAIPHGTGGIYSPAGVLQMNEIKDGLSQTLLLGEAAGQNIAWTEPRDVDFDILPIGINLPGSQKGASDGLFSSYHPGVTNVTFADGSARSLSEKIDRSILLKLLKADDGPLTTYEF